MEAINTLNAIFIRDLSKLNDEMTAYKNEESMWRVMPGTANSGGNLCLHLIGNLRHFIGEVIGKSGYIRNREAEFKDSGVSLDQIRKQIEFCKNEIENAFTKLDSNALRDPFPVPLGTMNGTTLEILLHLIGHFDYHLGQINYHRRIINSSY